MTPPLIADNQVRTFQEHTGGLTSIRRSILGGLNPAVRALLRNAKEVPSKNTKYRTFVTIGTERDAIIDFHALQPVYTDQRPFLIEGLVGKTKCTLKKSGNRISISISDPTQPKWIELIYAKN